MNIKHRIRKRRRQRTDTRLKYKGGGFTKQKRTKNYDRSTKSSRCLWNDDSVLSRVTLEQLCFLSTLEIVPNFQRSMLVISAVHLCFICTAAAAGCWRPAARPAGQLAQTEKAQRESLKAEHRSSFREFYREVCKIVSYILGNERRPEHVLCQLCRHI